MPMENVISKYNTILCVHCTVLTVLCMADITRDPDRIGWSERDILYNRGP